MLNNEQKSELHLEYESCHREAKGYHARAVRFQNGKEAFRGMVFNVASMALENYLTALCCLHYIRPLNHNYNCLVDAVESVMDFPKELGEDLRSLDEIFDICSVDEYHHGTPKPEDAQRVLKMCEQVSKLFDEA
jgi:hypothetical protein